MRHSDDLPPPIRNTLCPSYSLCLTSAARTDHGFSCDGCAHLGDRSEIDSEEPYRAAFLIRAIFADHEKPYRLKCRCLKCGTTFKRLAWDSAASPRRLCNDCLTFLLQLMINFERFLPVSAYFH